MRQKTTGTSGAEPLCARFLSPLGTSVIASLGAKLAGQLLDCTEVVRGAPEAADQE